MVQHCVVCGEVATTKCGGCKVTPYCSSEHQKLVYRYHKKICSLILPSSGIIPQPELFYLESASLSGLDGSFNFNLLSSCSTHFDSTKANSEILVKTTGNTMPIPTTFVDLHLPFDEFRQPAIFFNRSKELESLPFKDRHSLLVQLRSGFRLSEVPPEITLGLTLSNLLPFYRILALQITTDQFTPSVSILEPSIQAFFNYFCLIDSIPENRKQEMKYRTSLLSTIKTLSKDYSKCNNHALFAIFTVYSKYLEEMHDKTQELVNEGVNDKEVFKKLWEAFNSRELYLAKFKEMKI